MLMTVFRGIRPTLIAACCCYLVGCTSSTFNCSDDTSCQGLVDGQCEPNGFCSAIDDTCESGRRYGSLAPASIADQCVVSSDESTGVTPSGESTSSSGATSLTTSLTKGGPGSTVGVTTSGDTASSDTSGEPETTDAGESSTGQPPTPPLFDDDFERPDSEDIGNGWTEKTPEAFSIVDGALERTAGDELFTENLVYRTDLMAGDVELEAEFRYLDAASDTAPQVYGRFDIANSAAPQTAAGYYLFVLNAEELVIGRASTLDDITDFDTATPVPPLANGVDYRIRLRVVGSDPVELEGFLERMDDGEWLESARVEGQDGTPNALGPGSAAISGGRGLGRFVYERVAASPIE